MIAKTYVQTDAKKAWDAITEAVVAGAADVPCRIDGQGRVVYGAGTASSYTFGDDAAAVELPYEGAEEEYSIDNVRNFVKVTREGGLPQTSSNVLSPGDLELGQRLYERSNTLNVSDADALTLATSIYDTWRAPLARPRTMVVRPLAEARVWRAVLNLELEDTFVLKRRPPGSSTFSQTTKIAGLSHRIRPLASEWETSYNLIGQTL